MFLRSSIHLPFIFPVLYPYVPPSAYDILLFLPCFLKRQEIYTTGLQENIHIDKTTKRYSIPKILKAHWLTGTEGLLFSMEFGAMG